MQTKVWTPVTQTFTEFLDSRSLQGYQCGTKSYEIVPTSDYLSLEYDEDEEEYTITLNPLSEAYVGFHMFYLRVTMDDYTETGLYVEPLDV